MTTRPRRRPSQKKAERVINFSKVTPLQLKLATFVASAMVVVGGFFAGQAFLNNPENLTISQIDVQGELKYLKDTELKQVIGKYTKTNLYLLDAEALEADLETQEWIRQVRLQKEWPSRLIVWVEEQQPVAFWGEDRLMNPQGELFTADLPSMKGILPVLFSPEDKGYEIGERYLQVRAWLQGVPVEIAELTEDKRGAWRLRLKNGPEVLIGNKHQQQRIARLKLGLQKVLAPQLANIRRIDLRYTNGFAVEWKQPQHGSGVENQPTGAVGEKNDFNKENRA